MDARLGCLKAVHQLAPEQNELWEAFEKAVRHATAGRMARRADELKEISEASKPLYSSLDDPQKRKFELRSREIVMTVNGSMGGG